MTPIITEQDEDGEWVIADEQYIGEDDLMDQLIEEIDSGRSTE